MNPTREEALFVLALEKPLEKRAAFLDAMSEGDAALRQRLDALLAAHGQSEMLLATQPEAAQPTVKLDVADVPDEAVGQTLGRYKLLEKVGEGGCGVVYVAEQTEPVRRRVALKVIKLGMDTKQVVARFEAERQALAMMDHPNIAKVLDAGTTDAGRPYFVMELVRGIRITDYCDQANLTTKERLDLFIKVCQAIQHAHQKGIIHRDIKPSNILVTLHDGVPVPKVIDFGIAKAADGRLTDNTVYTQLHQFIGTPAYMSPEQAEMSGLDIDTRSDIYSLGVLLYELLAGSTPFDAKDLMASGIDVMRKTIREKEPPRPSTRLSQTLVAANVSLLQSSGGKSATEEEMRTDSRRLLRLKETIARVRGDLDWIVMKCLEKDRSRRYETANGLAGDLKRHLSSEPVTARPPSAGYRFQKAFWRNKLLFTTGAIVAAALVLGIGVSTWQTIVANRARIAAVRAETAEKEQRLAAQAAQVREAAERERAVAGEKETRELLYVANMNMAQQAWEQNNVGRVRQLLEETAAHPNRGFEWYYWQRQAHLELMTLRGHGAPINSVALSPDGRWLVSGSHDKTAKVWDVASGRELRTLKGHSDRVISVSFSPDGQRVVSGSWDQTARVWDAASGRELFILKGHSRRVNSAAFSLSGQQVVTGSDDTSAKVWDAASGRELLVLNGHGASVLSAAFSPDNQRIVTGSLDRTVKVWEVTSGRELLTLKGHDDRVLSAAFSPDSRRVITGSADRTAKVWDAASGREQFSLKGHSDWVQSVAFSPDNQRVVTGSADRTAKVWDAASRLEQFTLKGHSDWVQSVAFSLDGRRVVTGSIDSTAKVWDAASSGERIILKGHTLRIEAVAFSPDGLRVVTGSGDQTAKIWETASGRELFTLKGHSANVWSVAFSPDGQRVATGSDDSTAKVWDVVNGQELNTLKGHSNGIHSVAFSPDGLRVLTGGRDRTAKVWDAASGRELLTLKGHSDWVISAAFSPEGQRIVTGSRDQTAKMWDAASGRELLTLNGHSDAIRVAFSLDGQRAITGSWDRTAKIWEVASGRELLAIKGHGAPILSARFSPDGKRVVTGGGDQAARVWDAASGRELLTLKGHNDWVTSVAFSPDGQRMVTGSRDQTATVWETASAQEVAQWRKEEQTEVRQP